MSTRLVQGTLDWVVVEMVWRPSGEFEELKQGLLPVMSGLLSKVDTVNSHYNHT